MISTLIAVLICLQFLNSRSVNALEPQNLLWAALNDVLGPLRTLQLNSKQDIALARRCSKRTACEFPFPATELHEVAFKNGEVYVEANLSTVYPLILEMSRYYGGKYMHLQSSLIQIGQTADWIAGPKLNVVRNASKLCQWQNPNSKENVANTHALFLFPWETNNAFHALQDNILPMLSTVILHYLTSPHDDKVPNQTNPRYTLYVFNRIGRETMGAPALLYELLPFIFGSQNVLPAKALLRGGPHCVKHVSWGPAIKPFYRDSLQDLRRAAFDVLKHMINAHNIRKWSSVAPQGQISAVPNVRSKTLQTRQLKAIIVTRAGTLDSSRRLHPDTERQLAMQLQRAGYATEICCNFKSTVNTILLLVEKFFDVDICLGVHGAGLSNCIFGRRGMTIVELQTHHGYGVMSFPKLAHMSGGDYIFHDLRTVDSRRLLDVGIAVPEHVVEQVVNTAVKVHNFRNSLRIEHRTVTVGWSERLWSAINVFGTSKPVSWTETIVSESSKVTDEELHITSAEIRVAVVEPGSGTFHVKMQQNGVSAEQPQRYLTILNNILGVQYSVHSMDTWITDAYTNASLSNTHSRGSKSSSKRHQLKDSDKQLATIRRNNGTYWILFNPSVSAYSKESILGPPLKESYTTCVNLPYQQFRKLTLPPGNPNIEECDQNIQLRRRTGNHDAKLLSDFIK